MPYSALDIAKYIIKKEAQEGRAVSNLRLQKLLYFVQAQFLVYAGVPCFSESIEAWSFGPVVPAVYHEYKFYGSAIIPARPCTAYIRQEDRAMIDGILDACAKYSTSDLVTITHSQRPWIDARTRIYDRTIRNEDLKAFFGV